MPVACLFWRLCMLVASPVALTGAWLFLRFTVSSLYFVSRNGMNSGVLRMAHGVVQTFPVRHDRVCIEMDAWVDTGCAPHVCGEQGGMASTVCTLGRWKLLPWPVVGKCSCSSNAVRSGLFR